LLWPDADHAQELPQASGESSARRRPRLFAQRAVRLGLNGEHPAEFGVAGEGAGVHWPEPEQEAGVVGHGPAAGEPRQDIVAGSNRPRTGMLSDGLALPGET